ncbi:hypothetical protein TcYC6_0012330 [Trypanosoma cruzi]|nr:hypothetical protein TcYC6_0012330 [Trypanosoma cruzi]
MRLRPSLREARTRHADHKQPFMSVVPSLPHTEEAGPPRPPPQPPPAAEPRQYTGNSIAHAVGMPRLPPLSVGTLEGNPCRMTALFETVELAVFLRTALGRSMNSGRVARGFFFLRFVFFLGLGLIKFVVEILAWTNVFFLVLGSHPRVRVRTGIG